jgi:hypothetical protein
VAPGFNEAVLELVWKTTTEIYFEMAGSKGWTGMSPGETVEVPDVPELMLKVSLIDPDICLPLEFALMSTYCRSRSWRL